MVKCTPNQETGTITIEPARSNVTSGTATVTVGLVAADGTDLTPDTDDKASFTVTLNSASSAVPDSGPGAVVIRETPAAKPTIRLSPLVATIAVGKSTTVAATVTPSSASVKWTSANEKVATISNGKITGKGIGTTVVSGTVTANGYTVSADVTVRVTGSVTGLEQTSSKNGTWSAASKALTLTKAPSTSPNAVFSVKTSGTITSTATARVSVKDSNGKDASKYVSCTVGTDGKITVRPGTATASTTDKFTVTVDLAAREGGTSLTSSGGAYTFTVQIKGSDSGLNVASRKTS